MGHDKYYFPGNSVVNELGPDNWYSAVSLKSVASDCDGDKVDYYNNNMGRIYPSSDLDWVSVHMDSDSWHCSIDPEVTISMGSDVMACMFYVEDNGNIPTPNCLGDSHSGDYQGFSVCCIGGIDNQPVSLSMNFSSTSVGTGTLYIGFSPFGDGNVCDNDVLWELLSVRF